MSKQNSYTPDKVSEQYSLPVQKIYPHIDQHNMDLDQEETLQLNNCRSRGGKDIYSIIFFNHRHTSILRIPTRSITMILVLCLTCNGAIGSPLKISCEYCDCSS